MECARGDDNAEFGGKLTADAGAVAVGACIIGMAVLFATVLAVAEVAGAIMSETAF